MSNQQAPGKAPGRAPNGTFTKGHEKRGGRKRGTPNVMIPMLKEAIIEAAHLEGSSDGKDGLVCYLRRLARSCPAAYAQLLGKVLKIEHGTKAARDTLRSSIGRGSLSGLRRTDLVAFERHSNLTKSG